MTWPRRIVAANLVLLLLAVPTSARAQDVVPAPTYADAVAYMRTLPAETLIRIAWAGTGQADRAIAIARRESGLRCNADNPSSSAAGLFQTMGIHRARAERLGLTWQEIAGPDCLADVILAHDIWADSGWRPWAL